MDNDENQDAWYGRVRHFEARLSELFTCTERVERRVGEQIRENAAATAGQFAALRTETRQQIAELRTETRQQIAELRTETTQTRQQIAELSTGVTQMRGQIDDVLVLLRSSNSEPRR